MHRNMLLAIGLPLLGACSSGNTVQCVVGADCASGACSASGQCVASPLLEGGAPAANDSGFVLGDGGGDQGPSDGGITPLPGEDGATGCLPNGDGTITEAEVPMEVGLRASYEDAVNVTWSTAGTGADAGPLVWDLTPSFSGDQRIVFSAASPTGTWWASSFTAATYSTLLSASETLLGVFETGSSTLSLIGVVSPTNGTTQTELTYSTPVPTLQFPLSMGSSWNVTSNVTGQAEGFDTAYTEAYVSTVDAEGTMKTPYATFDNVLRVSTVLTRTVGVTPTVTRSYAWIAECFGVVASVTSQSDETSTEFSNDAEVRRLTP
jgi:hypothetical protein